MSSGYLWSMRISSFREVFSRNLKKRLLIIIAAISLLISFVFSFVGINKIIDWLKERWLEIFIAFIFAIIAGYVYEKIKPETKISQKTIFIKPRTVLAKLVLPNNNEIKIMNSEKEDVFGREDFVGVIPVHDLQFIGRRHFKVLKMDDGLYIEDLDSANGTKLNGEEINGAGRKELKDGDEILVADVLKMRYVHFQE